MHRAGITKLHMVMFDFLSHRKTQDMLAAAQQEGARLRTAHEGLQHEAAALRRLLQQAQADNTALQAQNQQMRQQLQTTVRQQQAQAQERIRVLESTVQDLRRQCEQLHQERTQMQQRLGQLESDVGARTKASLAMKQEIDNLRTQAARHSDRNKSLQQHVRELEVALDQSEEELEALKQQLLDARVEVARYQPLDCAGPPPGADGQPSPPASWAAGVAEGQWQARRAAGHDDGTPLDATSPHLPSMVELADIADRAKPSYTPVQRDVALDMVLDTPDTATPDTAASRHAGGPRS